MSRFGALGRFGELASDRAGGTGGKLVGRPMVICRVLWPLGGGPPSSLLATLSVSLLQRLARLGRFLVLLLLTTIWLTSRVLRCLRLRFLQRIQRHVNRSKAAVNNKLKQITKATTLNISP